MRLIPLCLLGLFAMGLAAPLAHAASPRGESRTAKVVKPAAAPRLVARAGAARPVVARPASPRQQPALRTASIGRMTPKAGGRVAQASVGRQTAKAGRRVASLGRGQPEARLERSGMTSRGARLTSWTAGLPAASGEQRDCPAGTMSTLARGHDDIVRCMPL